MHDAMEKKVMPVPEANRTLVIQSVVDSSTQKRTLTRLYVAGRSPTIRAIFLARAMLVTYQPKLPEHVI
jgi:hypothetical protein